MEFAAVVTSRRMVRRYLDHPVDQAFLERALTHATRAPSAGFTQGWSFLVLRTRPDVERFWTSTLAVDRPDGTEANAWLEGMRTAPVVIVILTSENAYRSRYAEADKTAARTRSAEMPWWQIDAAMAALLILQTATDAGLGACFFGIPTSGIQGLHRAFGIPDEFAPIGAITLGHPAPAPASGSPTQRVRRPLPEVAHEGNWGQAFRCDRV